MTNTTPDDLRASLAAARAELREALREAADGWDRLSVSGDGEVWTARQTAEHVIPGEAHYATLVCTACGYPGVEFDPRAAYETAGQAIAALDAVVELSNKKLKYVTETDLEKSHEGWTTAQFMSANAAHLRTHAAQLREAAGVSR